MKNVGLLWIANLIFILEKTAMCFMSARTGVSESKDMTFNV